VRCKEGPRGTGLVIETKALAEIHLRTGTRTQGETLYMAEICSIEALSEVAVGTPIETTRSIRPIIRTSTQLPQTFLAQQTGNLHGELARLQGLCEMRLVLPFLLSGDRIQTATWVNRLIRLHMQRMGIHSLLLAAGAGAITRTSISNEVGEASRLKARDGIKMGWAMETVRSR
jgi:hypothetical protein